MLMLGFVVEVMIQPAFTAEVLQISSVSVNVVERPLLQMFLFLSVLVLIETKTSFFLWASTYF